MILDHPEVIVLPDDQIAGGHVAVAEDGEGLRGFAVVLRSFSRDTLTGSATGMKTVNSCSMSLTTVVTIRSKLVTMRFSIWSGESPP